MLLESQFGTSDVGLVYSTLNLLDLSFVVVDQHVDVVASWAKQIVPDRAIVLRCNRHYNHAAILPT